MSDEVLVSTYTPGQCNALHRSSIVLLEPRQGPRRCGWPDQYAFQSVSDWGPSIQTLQEGAIRNRTVAVPGA